jgi:type I restriction enzyme S subunit
MEKEQAHILPEGWIEIELQDLVSSKGVFSDGDWVESKDQNPDGHVRLVQLADIGDMKFLDKSSRHMDAERADEMKCLFLQRNDLLISRLGDPLGKACLYPANEEKAVTVVDVCVFRAGHAYADIKLVGYFLNSISLRQLIDSQASGTTRKRITGKKLKKLPFRLPPLNEQRRIVDKIETLFSDLDKGEEHLRTTQKLLKRYRQSVLKAAVTGELTKDWREKNRDTLEPGKQLLERTLKTRREQWQGRGKYKEPTTPNTKNLPELPEEWVWCRAEQIAVVMGGLTKNAKRKEFPLKRPMLRVGNVYQNRLELDDVHDIGIKESELGRVLLEHGDLLIVEGNGSKDQIGRMALWENQIPDCVHQNHLIKARFVEKRLTKYALLWFRSLNGRKIIEEVASSTSGLHTLSLSKIDNLTIPLPSVEEAEEITDRVTDIFSQIDALEVWCATELKRSNTLRQSVLKSAFSGKLVPQGPVDEPASELLKRIQEERSTSKPAPKRGRKSKNQEAA